jgi:hypothetical protein
VVKDPSIETFIDDDISKNCCEKYLLNNVTLVRNEYDVL